MKVSIILPTTGRCERALDCLKRLVTTLRKSQTPNWEIIAVIDADPATRDAFAGHELLHAVRLQIDYSDSLRGIVRAWNDGLALAKGEYIVLAADDLVFTEGWLDEALAVMATLPGGSGLVGFNDGHWEGSQLATHYLLHRQFIIDHLGGRLAWDCYGHSFHDVEANERAKRAGRFAWAEKAIVKHEHWIFGDRPQDDTDRRNLGAHEAARQAYEARKALGFPDDYPPVIGPQKTAKIRIGYLVDVPPYAGGAEMSAAEMAEAAPEGVELVACPPGQVAKDCAAYVVHNCTSYALEDIETDKPIFKVIHDEWPHQPDTRVRKWLLDNARALFFSSPLHVEAFRWSYTARAVIDPVVMKVQPYEAVARSANGHRQGHVWIGRMFPGKGIGNAIKWAREHQAAIDFYGFGPRADVIRPPDRYCGTIRLEDVPATLARYETFVFLPDAIEPFSRTTAEAYFAGLKLVVNRNVGALHWLQNCPGEIPGAAARKWKQILEAARDR